MYEWGSMNFSMKLARKFIAFCATILCFLLVACSANKIDGNSTHLETIYRLQLQAKVGKN